MTLGEELLDLVVRLVESERAHYKARCERNKAALELNAARNDLRSYVQQDSERIHQLLDRATTAETARDKLQKELDKALGQIRDLKAALRAEVSEHGGEDERDQT